MAIKLSAVNIRFITLIKPVTDELHEFTPGTVFLEFTIKRRSSCN